MSGVRLVSASLAAIALATAPVVLSASDNAVQSKDGRAVQSATIEKEPSTTLATLKAIKAAPMSSSELDAVKGLDAHFLTVNSKNDQLMGITGLHVVVRNNRDHWLDLGNGILVAPAYRGLCDAALKSPGMIIPGQNPVTGIGGGC
jgi:hypothetical protein